MREARKVDMLDDVSDHLAEVLRRADALLAEWSKFGAAVQDQVQREARAIGDAVASSVEGAVTAATLTAVDRALAEQINGRLRALAAELDRLEQRTKTAANGVKRERSIDRKILWIVVAGVVAANALLVLMFVRDPDTIVAPPPEPLRIETPVQTPVTPDAGPVTQNPGIDAPTAAEVGSGSGSAVGSAAPAAKPVKPIANEVLQGGSGSRPMRVPTRPRKKK
jgi:hypothetical protein